MITAQRGTFRHSWFCLFQQLRAVVNISTIVTVFHRKECCTDGFLLKGTLYRWFLSILGLMRSDMVDLNLLIQILGLSLISLGYSMIKASLAFAVTGPGFKSCGWASYLR